MSLQTGTRLGRYEIRSQIGAGGMGEVYLAQDTQLDRTVALKVLPAEIAADTQRLHRFLQEARAASKLKGANVAHIYEIGETADGLRFIAMEYVEGVQLNEKTRKRQLPAAEIIPIANQIARALEEAHSKGVTHRDIKPQNIIITPEGEVKVLDFGLAKLESATAARDETPDSELATRVKTSPGVVMGTVNYMSPEQAMGREVDQRTDIFSFGIVLYEMATGHVPFSGSSLTETIDRIVHAQPEAIARFNYDIPAELEVIIKKALRKNADERYQTAREMLVDLRALQRELDIAAHLEHSAAPDSRSSFTTEAPAPAVNSQGTTILTSDQQAQSTVETAATRTNVSSAEYIAGSIKQHKRGAILALAAVVLAAGALSLLWYKFIRVGRTRTGPHQMKITRLVTGLTGRAGTVNISPDGKYVAYAIYEAGKAGLWVRQVSQDTSLQLVPPAEEAWFTGTAFSPDNELVYFVMGNNRTNTLASLYQIPVLGGREPKKILDHVSSSISFSPDGKQFVFSRDYDSAGESVLFIGNTDGSGEPRKLTSRGGADWLSAGAWSPDGKRIAFITGTTSGGISFSLFEIPAAGGQERLITDHKWGNQLYRVLWIENGDGLIVNGMERSDDPTQIWHISYPDGEVSRVTNDLNEYGGQSFGVTADSSTIATILSEWSSKIWVAAPNDDESHARKITNGKQDGRMGLSLMPDGRIIYAAKVGENTDIWIMNADGTGGKPLTSDAFADSRPTVSPDGRYILYQSFRPDNIPHIWRMDADGSNPKQLTTGSDDYSPKVSPDGRWVVFHSWRSGRANLWKVPIEGGQPAQISNLVARGPNFSPDGKQLSCMYFDESVSPPRYRPAIISFEDGQLVRVVDLPTTASNFSWSADAKELLYIDSPGDIGNIWSMPAAGGAAKQLTKFTSEFIDYFDVSRDVRRFIIARDTGTNDIILIKDFR